VSTPFASIIGVALGAAYLFDLCWPSSNRKQQAPLWGCITGGTIAMISLVAAFLFARPAPGVMAGTNGHLTTYADFSNNLSFIGRDVWRPYCPIDGTEMFPGLFGSNLLDPFPWVEMVLGWCLFAGAVLFLLPRLTALLFYVVGTVTLVAFYRWSLMPYSLRHEGHIFVVFIVGCWISYYCRELSLQSQLLRWHPMAVWRRQQSAFLTVILGVQAIGALSGLVREQVTPYSGSREAAEIIRQKAPANIPVLGDMPYAAEPVSGCLDRPIFIPTRGDYCTFIKIDAKTRIEPPATQGELAKSIREVMAAEKRDVVLMVNFNLSLPADQAELLGVVTQSMWPDEKYIIYLIKYRGQ
jgi:hypothetical protein